jgi:hypothetical protein
MIAKVAAKTRQSLVSSMSMANPPNESPLQPA